MTTEHEMALEIAKEIGKQVPVKQVYDDAASPAARQIGATFEDVVKCIRLVGFPIQWLAVQQDKFRAFIEEAKRAVPDERLILPAPQILGPVLEGIRYQIEDTPIREAFRRLLSRAMDTERVSEAHPAFPGVINRISADEAYLLLRINEGDIITEGEIKYGTVTYVGPCDFEADVVENSTALTLYINNLESLGLIKAWAVPLQTERMSELFQLHDSGQNTWGNRSIGRLYLSQTPMGAAFTKACMLDP